LVAILAAASITTSACGGDKSNGGTVPGVGLTIFSSLPLQGPDGARARSILNGEKLALSEAGGKVGDFQINFSFYDDTADVGGKFRWDPNRVAENARKAVENLRTIAYIGDFDSGASAVSIPITNEAGFAQVSPGSTAVGLTKFVPGAEKGEPDKFYPSGERNFARVVPADDVEASAAAGWARKLKAKSVFVLGDKSLEGDGLAELFKVAAGREGLRVLDQDRMDPRAKDYRDLAAKVAKTRPDAVFFGGGTTNAARLWSNLHAAVPGALLIGAHDLLFPDFYGRLGAAEGRTKLTSVAQDPSQLPADGQRFLRDYRRQFHQRPDPFGAYGYTAMKLVLDALRRAGGSANNRPRVIRELLDTSKSDTATFKSAVGTFSIDDNGDTSLDRIAGYRVRGGKLQFDADLRGQPSG
jgi:branched-chain amino acid transport system substrate-binding protein